MDIGIISLIRMAIAGEVENAVSNTKQDLLNSMAILMDSRLNNLQSNLQQSQLELSNTQRTKFEETVSDNFKFPRKGNENQFWHSVKVMSKSKEAQSVLDSLEVAAAKEKISERYGFS